MKLRRTLAKLVGGAHEASPGEEIPTETVVDEEGSPPEPAGTPSRDLAITFTLVERPRDDQ